MKFVSAIFNITAKAVSYMSTHFKVGPVSKSSNYTNFFSRIFRFLAVSSIEKSAKTNTQENIANGNDCNRSISINWSSLLRWWETQIFIFKIITIKWIIGFFWPRTNRVVHAESCAISGLPCNGWIELNVLDARLRACNTKITICQSKKRKLLAQRTHTLNGGDGGGVDVGDEISRNRSKCSSKCIEVKNAQLCRARARENGVGGEITRGEWRCNHHHRRYWPSIQHPGTKRQSTKRQYKLKIVISLVITRRHPLIWLHTQIGGEQVLAKCCLMPYKP